MSKITINGVTFDPLSQERALAAANLHSADAAQSNYILIQTAQPLCKEMKNELENIGVVILEYVPDDTYLCNYKGTDLGQIRSLAYVVWVNIYMQGFKVPPSLTTKPTSVSTGTRNLLEIAALPTNTLSTAKKVVDVVFHSNVNPQSIREKLAAVALLDASDLNLTRHKIRLTVEAKNLNDLASIDEVRHVEEALPMKLHNDIARQILNVEPSPNPGTTFEGAGQTVAVADTGFDTGSTTNVHEAFTGRVERLYALGRTNANDPHGHGTHVAGSVLGDGNSAALGHSVRGTAPAARLVLQSVLDNAGGLGGLPADLNDLFQPPYDDDGVRIHTNSWGSQVGDGRYNSNSTEVDEFVWNNRDCVICFAAGNEGEDRNANGVIDPRSITPPATARNCIAIGATENERPNFTTTYQQAFSYPADPVASDQMANNPDGMVAFSSRGPTTDGRIKPDVVAPGSFILSAKSRDASSPGWGPSADPLYFFNGGTSMATPLVAGCTALVREYIIEERQIATPSAALIKAMLVNGAQDIAGQYVPSETGGIPNNSEGFGRVDMAATLNASVQLQDEATELDTGDEETITVAVNSGASLKVTLVWTDRPGPTLQNDLDLIVQTADGQERHGNVAPNSTDFDRNNNVEQVIWENIPAGNVDIIVRAHRIPSFSQSYALVTRIGGGAQPQQGLEINGPEVQGEIDPAGESDIYSFRATNAGTYTIETSGTIDTFLSLYGPDSETTLVATDDDSGPGTLSLLTQDLAAGQYFVRIRHYSPTGTGSYGVLVRSNNNDGHEQLQINGPDVLGEIDPAGESDIYSFRVTVAGKYTLETSGTTDTYLSLFGPGSETTLIATDDDSGPGALSLLVEDLVAGQYFVRVRHYSPTGTGSYGVSARSNNNPSPVQLQVNGPVVQGNIEQPAETDLYTFSVNAAGEHIIETSGSTDTFLSLFGPNNDTDLIAQDDDSGTGTLSRIQESLAEGTYFVRVRHYSPAQTGTYGVMVRRV